MPTTDFQKLVLVMEARLDKAEKSMRRLTQFSDQSLGKVERRFAQTETRLAGFGKNLGRNFAAGFNPASLLAGLTAGGIASFAKSAVRDLAEIKDNADRAGLSIKDMQTLTFAAGQSGGGAGDIVDIFQKLNKNLAEARAKGGDLAKILEANNVSLTDANGNVRNNKELFLDILNLIRNTTNEQDQQLLAQLAMGRAAGDLLTMFKGGSAEIEKWEAQARRVGFVISDEIVNKAALFDDRWEAAWNTWTAQGKAAAVEVMSFIDQLNKNFGTDLWEIITDPKLAAAKAGMRISDSLLGRKAPTDEERNKSQLTDLYEQIGRKGMRVKELGDLLDNPLPNTAPAEMDEQRAVMERLRKEMGDLSVAIESLERQMARVGGLSPFESQRASSGGRPTKFNGVGSDAGILDLIASRESGGGAGGGYNTTLGHGKWSGGERELVTMTLDEIDAMQSQMKARQRAAGISESNLASPAGRYQIVQRTMRGLRKQLGLSGSDLFTPDLQDQLGATLVQRRGRNPAELRNEFEGLRNVSDADILSAYDRSAPERTKAREQEIKATEQLDKAALEKRQKLLEDAAEHLKDVNVEAAEKAKEAHEEAAEASLAAWEQFNGPMIESVFGSIESALDELIDTGKINFKDFLTGMVKDLAKTGVHNLLGMLAGNAGGGAAGGGTGIIGALFGGMFAEGGRLPRGKWGVVGEKGPELAFAGNSDLLIKPNYADLANRATLPRMGGGSMNLKVEAWTDSGVLMRVVQLADSRAAARDVQTLDIARRSLPGTIGRHQALGTTRGD